MPNKASRLRRSLCDRPGPGPRPCRRVRDHCEAKAQIESIDRARMSRVLERLRAAVGELSGWHAARSAGRRLRRSDKRAFVRRCTDRQQHGLPHSIDDVNARSSGPRRAGPGQPAAAGRCRVVRRMRRTSVNGRRRQARRRDQQVLSPSGQIPFGLHRRRRPGRPSGSPTNPAEQREKMGRL